MKYYRDDAGRYLGGWDVGAPVGAIEVPFPPAHAAMTWTGEEWIEPADVLVRRLTELVDAAADAARHKVAGDPLRAVEYDRARIEAEEFAAGGFAGDPPPMVAAWAINGRTPQQAAEDILSEAAAYTAALVQLRAVRLSAKEQIRSLVAEERWQEAEQIAAGTVAAIAGAVEGVGNNG